MRKFKALLIDLDGTTVLSRPMALPSPRITTCIQSAGRKVVIVPVTGRPYELSKKVLSHLGLQNGLGVFSGGSSVCRLNDGSLLSEVLLDDQQIKKIAENIANTGLRVSIGNTTDSVLANQLVDNDIEPVSRIVIRAIDEDRFQKLSNTLKTIEKLYFIPASSWSGDGLLDIHITHVNGSKIKGAQTVLKNYNIELSETIAVGDHFNDTELIQEAGLGVAMGNAPDEVKSKADYVAPTIYEDGLAQVIERFILN